MTRLVADAGGTNVRFALAAADGAIDRVCVSRVMEFATFADALSAYLAGVSAGAGAITAAAIAAAGPVDGDAVTLTNNPWRIVRSEVSAMLAGAPVALVNDIEAIAAALPHLAPDEVPAIGPPAPVRPELRTMLALNVGTGFGAATVIHRDGHWLTCPSEAGHMSLGHGEGLEFLGADAEIESILSGHGLARLATGLGHSHFPDAADVLARMADEQAAAQAVAIFTRALGRVAADLVLATCAWGGVYFCGSVAQAWSTQADVARFRAAFARTGPMRRLIERVPTAVVRRRQAALFGLALLPVPDAGTEPQRAPKR